MLLWIIFILFLIVLSIGLFRHFVRVWIYDVAIIKMTRVWYREVLKRLPDNARVLDVGIGTGTALICNKDLIKQKNITVVGIDYDKDYVNKCRNLIIENQLESLISVHHVSVYDFQEKPFDIVYFSGSLMIMPDPVAALKHVSKLLSANGRIYCTQSFERAKRSRLFETAKPLLKFITTIDFGRLYYEDEFLLDLKKASLRVVSHEKFGEQINCDYKITVAQPE